MYLILLYRSFKPYYKWNTFNTLYSASWWDGALVVLNLIINGIPSILRKLVFINCIFTVLNLIINGIPSIP